MALWKPLRGNRTALDTVEKHDGYVYFCVDDGSLFFDYLDTEGNLQRKQINAKEAEELTGYSISSVLNNSDLEIPTSKTVLDAIEVVKTDMSAQDTVILAEAQNNIATERERAEGVEAELLVEVGIVKDAIEAVQDDIANTAIVVLAEAQTYIDGAIADIEIPTIPTNVSAFENDKGYLTEHQSIKTINGESLIGTGNITISGGEGGSGGGIIDVVEFPSNPSTSSIYRKWQVIKAEWVMDGNIVTDGGMTCEVVNTLPEVGEVCYTGSVMYSYYQRADGECYGYVDSNLSATMGVPAGWYPAAVLFGALGFSYNGMIDSLADATTGYFLLLTKKPHLYHYYDDNKGSIVKSAIITNDNYDFDENLGILTQVIVL